MQHLEITTAGGEKSGLALCILLRHLDNPDADGSHEGRVVDQNAETPLSAGRSKRFHVATEYYSIGRYDVQLEGGCTVIRIRHMASQLLLIRWYQVRTPEPQGNSDPPYIPPYWRRGEERRGVRWGHLTPQILTGGDLLSFFHHLFDGSDHVERLFRNKVELAVHDASESANGVFDRDVHTRATGEGFRHVERLG